MPVASLMVNPLVASKLAQVHPALHGPGASALEQEIDGFLLRSPDPGSSEIVGFLKLYSGVEREAAARGLIARGVSANAVSAALRFLDTSSSWDFAKIGGLLTIASAAASGYHGYRRNRSIWWGAVWFVLGGIFPVFTPVIAVAQGFGKRKGS